MTKSKKSHLLFALAVFAALLAGSGCGGSEESTTSSGAGPSVNEQTMESGEAAAPLKQGQAQAKSRDRDEPGSDRRGNRSKAEEGEGKPAATDPRGHDDPERPDGVEKRVRELVEGDSGTQVVDSGRELKKVLREIKRSKQRQGVPPVVEEILEEARGEKP